MARLVSFIQIATKAAPHGAAFGCSSLCFQGLMLPERLISIFKPSDIVWSAWNSIFKPQDIVWFSSKSSFELSDIVWFSRFMNSWHIRFPYEFPLCGMEVVVLSKGGDRHSVLIAYSSHRRCLHYDSAPFRLAEPLLQRVGAIRYIISIFFFMPLENSTASPPFFHIFAP